jgi:uncharacterized protein involved in type VI secretion and phage assembly
MSAMPGQTVDKKYFGVATGIVQRVEDDPEKECRVQLTLPWYDGATISEWCRVAQPYAGNGYGASFVPEKGDEVLVAFDQGDMRYPVVIGCLYNGVDSRPRTAPAAGTRSCCGPSTAMNWPWTTARAVRPCGSPPPPGTASSSTTRATRWWCAPPPAAR